MSDALRGRRLESVKKEATQWLHALHANDDDARARLRSVVADAHGKPTLRDVQHALALEYGLSSWGALKSRVLADGAATIETLAHYREKVDALLDAYRTGAPAAMERHYRLTWHRRVWSAMRTYVQIDLGKVAGDDVAITDDDARWLIAREHGFDDWESLTRSATTEARPAQRLAKPMAVLTGAPRADADLSARSRVWHDVLSELAEPEVTGLDAHGQCTDEMAREIAACTNLTWLRLGGSAALTNAGVQSIAAMPNVRYLDISGTSVTNEGAITLGQLRSLQHVSLAHTRVSDRGVESLAECSALEHVDLNGSFCGDGALRTFAGKSNLRRFRVGRATTDAGLPALHDYPVFTVWRERDEAMSLMSYSDGPNELMLRGDITDRGMAALRGLNGLFGLNLDDRALAITGDGLLPLLDLPRLGRLAFDAHDDAMPIVARMPALKFFGCQDTDASDAAWATLGASQSIEAIWGRRCHGLSDNGFRALSRMPRLAKLSVSCLNVNDSAVALLPDFPSLRELMPMDIPDAGYRHIGQCTSLDSLVLMYCRDTTDVATDHLLGLSALTYYFASYTQITDRTPALLSQIPSLERVTLDSCARVTDDGVAQLAALPKLRELRVSGRGITSAVRSAFPARVVVHYAL